VPSPGVALAGLVALNLMWGGSLPATKLALESFGPFSLAAARLVLAAGLFLSVLRPAALRRLPRGDGLQMAGLGVVGFGGGQVLQALGAGLTSGATATVLASTSPLWVAVLAPVLLRERLHTSAVLGLLLALAGVVAITGLGEQGVLAGSLVGNAVIMLSCASFGLYTVLGKDLSARYSPMVFCGVSCLGGALATVPFAAWELSVRTGAASAFVANSNTVTAWPTPLGWLLLGYLSIAVTFVGFAVLFWGIRALPAAQAGALVFLQPLSGLVLAILILGDRPTSTFLAGCALVLGGVYLAAGGFSRALRL
jgi:drug/metabolite transporter (DMT)-like permease